MSSSTPPPTPTPQPNITSLSTDENLTTIVKCQSSHDEENQNIFKEFTKSVISYLYSVETATDDVSFVAPLQSKIVKSLASIIGCNDDDDDDGRRHLFFDGGIDRRQLDVISITTSPLLSVNSEVTCDPILNETNFCFVISGNFTLISNQTITTNETSRIDVAIITTLEDDIIHGNALSEPELSNIKDIRLLHSTEILTGRIQSTNTRSSPELFFVLPLLVCVLVSCLLWHFGVTRKKKNSSTEESSYCLKSVSEKKSSEMRSRDFSSIPSSSTVTNKKVSVITGDDCPMMYLSDDDETVVRRYYTEAAGLKLKGTSRTEDRPDSPCYVKQPGQFGDVEMVLKDDEVKPTPDHESWFNLKTNIMDVHRCSEVDCPTCMKRKKGVVFIPVDDRSLPSRPEDLLLFERPMMDGYDDDFSNPSRFDVTEIQRHTGEHETMSTFTPSIYSDELSDAFKSGDFRVRSAGSSSSTETTASTPFDGRFANHHHHDGGGGYRYHHRPTNRSSKTSSRSSKTTKTDNTTNTMLTGHTKTKQREVVVGSTTTSGTTSNLFVNMLQCHSHQTLGTDYAPYMRNCTNRADQLTISDNSATTVAYDRHDDDDDDPHRKYYEHENLSSFAPYSTRDFTPDSKSDTSFIVPNDEYRDTIVL